MKVSVIIPVYNVEKYLRRCLDSVVNQTYKDIEVILVNDGSPDNSKEICEEYVAKYSNIQLINQKNAGLGAARNTGLQYITGNAVTFVDSDDWLELDAIEYYVASMKKSDADIVVTQMIRKKEYFSNEGTNGTTIKEEVLNQEQFAKKYFKIDGNNIEYYACAKLYKREIAREVKYPVGLFAEDVPAAFGYIIRSQKIFYSTKVTYNYFFNDNSLTAKFTDKDFDLEKIWDLVVEEAKVYGNEDYILYAKVNRYRIDFNLLCRIALSEN
ncbi:TPA: glycosyltransferase family 2 protein, partial [Streptococcus pneumoniae]|nr:glycosyltransferase family 2 protein [Streptococcus pneumoniae]